MIFVERSEALPTKTVTAAEAERDKVLEAMAPYLAAIAEAVANNTDMPEKPKFTFAQYKTPVTKGVLERLFAGKCAYCESFYSSTQPMDVEHYRPKGAVRLAATETETHHGYYWLAASFDNLLPSCIDCNRERTQDLVTSTGTQAKKLGKHDQFPVAGTRARTETDLIADEQPLLINPSIDDPTDFFKYDTELGLVEPVPDPSDVHNHRRATESISIYGLNRSGLVHDRLHVIKMIDHRLAMIGRLASLRERIPAGPQNGDVRGVLREVIELEIAALFELQQANRPYAGLVRQLLQDLHPDSP